MVSALTGLAANVDQLSACHHPTIGDQWSGTSVMLWVRVDMDVLLVIFHNQPAWHVTWGTSVLCQCTACTVVQQMVGQCTHGRVVSSPGSPRSHSFASVPSFLVQIRVSQSGAQWAWVIWGDLNIVVSKCPSSEVMCDTCQLWHGLGVRWVGHQWAGGVWGGGGR